MELKINVSGSQLDNDVKDLIASLSQEQKSELAVQLLQKTLDSANTGMSRILAEERALKLLSEQEQGRKFKLIDGRLRDADERYDLPYGIDDRFRKLISEFNDTGIFFKDKVLKRMVEVADERVRDMVEKAPAINDALEEAKKKITDMLPKMVHDAMVIYFASQMENVMKAIVQTSFVSANTQQIVTNLQQQLNKHGIY